MGRTATFTGSAPGVSAPTAVSGAESTSATPGPQSSIPSVWEVVSAYLHSGTAAVEAAPEPVRGTSDDRVAQVRCLLDKIDADTPRVERGSTRDALRQLFAQTEVSDRCQVAAGHRGIAHRSVDLTAAPSPALTAASGAAAAAPGLDHLPPPPVPEVATAQGAHLPAAPAAPARSVAPSATPPHVERPDEADGPVEDPNVVIDLRDGVDQFHVSVPDRFERVPPGAPEVLRRPIQKYGTVRRDTIDDAVVRWYTMRHGTRPTVSHTS